MKFEVMLTQKEIYCWDCIEANSEEEAKDKAYAMYEQDKECYHYDSDCEIECVELDGGEL